MVTFRSQTWNDSPYLIGQTLAARVLGYDMKLKLNEFVILWYDYPLAHVILKSNQDFFRIQNGSIKYPKGTFLLLDTLGLFTFECFHLKWWKFAFNWAQVPPRYIFQIHHFYPSYPILWDLLTLWSPKWWCNIFLSFALYWSTGGLDRHNSRAQRKSFRYWR